MKKTAILCGWKTCKFNKDRNCTKELITLRDTTLGPKVCLACDDYEDSRPEPKKRNDNYFGGGLFG